MPVLSQMCGEKTKGKPKIKDWKQNMTERVAWRHLLEKKAGY